MSFVVKNPEVYVEYREGASERVGLDRRIRRAWLDRTAELVREQMGGGPSAGESDPAVLAASVRAALARHLEEEIAGSDARRKTVNVLTRIWVRVPPEHRALRDEALALWEALGAARPSPGLSPDLRLALHWGLCLLAYPFFRDLAATLGRLLRVHDRVTAGLVYRRVAERWGERSTLVYAVQRALSSLADWGVLEAGADGRGPYHGAPPLRTDHPDLSLWLLEAALRARSGGPDPWSAPVALHDLPSLPELFPFAVDLPPGAIHRSPRFFITRNGDGVELVSPAPR